MADSEEDSENRSGLLGKDLDKSGQTVELSAEVVAGRQWLVGEARISRLADGGVRVVAPAKINLTLWVGSRRADGFHEIESIVAWISLADRLTVYQGGGNCELNCTDPGLACGGSNLVIRAAQALAKQVGRPANLRMHLEKAIPMGAGLGGGSSDAAACLLALTTLWNISYDNHQLSRIAAELGSDVPLFLAEPICVIRGRGELVEPVGFDWPFWAVLLLANKSLATAGVYDKFDQLLTERPGDDRIKRCDLGLYQPETLGAVMFNMLAPAAFELLPELASLGEALLAAGAANVQISGSGSAIVCLFNSLESARRLVNRLSPQLRTRTWIVHGGHR